MSGWGEHTWGGVTGPWGGFAVYTPVIPSNFIFSWDDPEEDDTAIPFCRRGFRFSEDPDDEHALCSLFPQMYCDDDLDPNAGGTGDHHKLLEILKRLLFGYGDFIGLVDRNASIPCIKNPDEAPERYLDRMLHDLGFNIDVGLSVEDKRRVIPVLGSLYSQKGTVSGIENALSVLLGIPVDLLPLNGPDFEALECGEEFSRTLTDITSASSSVVVDHPERFEIGKNLDITDVTAPYVYFTNAPITNILGNTIYFDAQALTGTIEAGAQIFCERLDDQVGMGLGVDSSYGSQDPGLYGFYVDVQKTVETMGDLEDGDTEVELSDAEYAPIGSRIRLRDTTSPTNPDVVVTVLERNGNTISFEPVSLTATIEAGAEAMNLFNSEQETLINRVVSFAKPIHTHHMLTKDYASAVIEIG